MGDIRIVGRARGGRCVFCHDGLGGEVARCPECRAAWHRECAADARRCPTLGCSGPPPGSEVGRQRTTRLRAVPDRPAPREETAAARPPAWTVDRPRPGALVRLGPYARLLLSGAWNLAVFVGLTALVVAALTHPAATWKALSTGKHGAHVPAPLALLHGLLVAGMIAVGLWLSGRWLLRWPSCVAETRALLERTTPALLYLTTFTTGSGKHTKRWARLRGRHGEYAGRTYEWRLDGILPPWWLTHRGWSGEPVLVYGLPPPGPYVLEFQDGLLALVHPDVEEDRAGRG